ncbi:hypothetical protein HDU87_007147 [Geranomyces variabilis]|uniref:F-box domain-containing protein n=1 Tax=Geranomyces variabilis TaxID=109894 RepID=A0AAD5TFW9_9FUNG|nr:hypothetical protein HDU87_007147 [Geranomyces variabilis]
MVDQPPSPNPQPTPPIAAVARMPPELLDAIFLRLKRSDLGACCRVNRAWFDAAHPRIWSRIEAYAHEWKKYYAVLSKPKALTTDYRKCIQQISLLAPLEDDHDDLKRHSLAKILKFTPRLTVLKLDFPALSGDDLWILSASCQQLMALSIVGESSRPDSRQGNDEGLAAVVKNCHKLQHLRLKSGVTSQALLSFTSSGLRAVANACHRRLKTFALDCVGSEIALLINLDTDEGRRMGDAICDILTGNPQLETLSLDWPTLAIDPALEVAAASLRNLRTFRVGYAMNIHAVTSILASNPLLHTVSLCELSTLDAVGAFLDPLRANANLRHLTLDGAGFFNQVLPVIPQFAQLETIEITPSRQSASLHHALTDEYVAATVSACSNLTALKVPIQSDLPLLAIAANCPNLVSLDICNGKEITDSALMLLARRCNKLETLRLGARRNNQITDDALVVVAESLPGLRRLSIPLGCARITFKTLAALAAHCPSLETLGNVPAAVGLNALMIYIPKMERLVALSLLASPRLGSHVDQQGLAQLKMACERLHQITQFA